MNFIGAHAANGDSSSAAWGGLVIAERVVPASAVFKRVDLNKGRGWHQMFEGVHHLFDEPQFVFPNIVLIEGRRAGV